MTPSAKAVPGGLAKPRRAELAADLRSFPFGRYVIFYAPIEDGIDVVRVLHGARDIDAVFGEDQ